MVARRNLIELSRYLVRQITQPVIILPRNIIFYQLHWIPPKLEVKCPVLSFIITYSILLTMRELSSRYHVTQETRYNRTKTSVRMQPRQDSGYKADAASTRPLSLLPPSPLKKSTEGGSAARTSSRLRYLLFHRPRFLCSKSWTIKCDPSLTMCLRNFLV